MYHYSSSRLIQRLSMYYTLLMIYVIVPVTIIGGICMFIIDKKAKKEVHDKGIPTIATIVRKDGPHLTYDVKYHGMYYSSTINVKRRVMINTQIGDKFPALILKEKYKRAIKDFFPIIIKLVGFNIDNSLNYEK